MIKRLVGEINQKCHRDNDVLYHVGDFVLYGKERGIENSRIKPIEFEKMIKPSIVHILGNHDLNNGVKGALLGSYIKIGKKVAWVQHIPPWYDGYEAPTNADIYICGHVHDKWKFRTYNGKLVINVGVDVWNYRPVSVKDIIGCYDKFKNGKLPLK
jgi:calcineurin-like phosphoesterase family protein